MKYPILGLSATAVITTLITTLGSVSPAGATEVCKVSDPTGTPLNVRESPNGQIINALKNGRVIDILEYATDEKERSWVKVAGNYQGQYRVWGWVFRNFTSCQREVFMPQGSTLFAPKVSRRAGIHAQLEGKTWVTGTLVTRWVPSNDLLQDQRQIWLIPDDREALPRFKPYDSDISISDGKQLLPSILSSSQATQISTQVGSITRVHGRFLITNYETGVVCDSGWTRATLVDAKIPKASIAIASKKALLTGC